MTQSDTLSTAGLFLSIFLKLGLVLLLIYSGLIILRRIQLNKSPLRRKYINVLETSHLSPHRAIHLIQVGQVTFLVGATDQNIHLLSKIDDPEIHQTLLQSSSEGEEKPVTVPAFAAVLFDNITRRKSNP
jgi:flagellar biogenesis protein FliO